MRHPLKATLLLTLAVLTSKSFADDSLAYQTETLDNGLKVVYAPLPTSPVTQVRVLYHVGSKDERPDRQGFAHMFEHMMFRGSAHVGPEEHMKRIGLVGGESNAFTTFDQTVYHDTLPSSSTELALWLEADRMSSFKVSPEIFRKERLVVAEEWRWRSNTPYGTLEEELLPEVFSKHSYRWAPIGDMQQLLASSTGELQAFFNKYYIPNNAVLVIAGNIDIQQTKDQVHRYFGWIPKGADFQRPSPVEPPQTEPRRKQVTMRVPLSRMLIAFRMPPTVADDNDALGLMLAILGQGQSSRLSRALVTNADPSCIAADAWCETIGMGSLPLEDGGFMGLDATLLNGKKIEDVEKILKQQITDIATKPVTTDELEKAKQQGRLALANRWQTAESTATELGDYFMYYGNLDRVSTERARMEAVTPADIQRVAAKYLAENLSNTLIINPGIPPAPATQAALSQPATEPVAKEKPHEVTFPADYPTTPPASGKIPTAVFDKGVESTLGASTKLIVMENHRVPMVYWTIAIRAGEFNSPLAKAGLASMTAQMLQRGPKGKTYDQFNDELESRGINLGISTEDGDVTRITGSCLTEQLPFALAETKDMLENPAFDPNEFANLKSAAIDDLRLGLTNPQTVATRTLNHAIFGDSPLGKLAGPDTISAITLDDVKAFYKSTFQPAGAIILISGDIKPDAGRTAAETYFGKWASSTAAPPTIDYPATPDAKHRIILVDAPVAKQASIRIGIPGYNLASPDKPAGVLLGQILSAGIESRLNKYVRAEKGLVYGVTGYFEPQRHGGTFEAQTETKFETAAETVQAIFKVLDDTKNIPIPETEVGESRFRVAGALVMSMEKIEDQAKRRLEGLLDGYPADYYDKYPERLSKVTPQTLADVMKKYLDDDRMTIVVAAPAEKVKAQLEKLGTVEVIPMPITENK